MKVFRPGNKLKALGKAIGDRFHGRRAAVVQRKVVDQGATASEGLLPGQPPQAIIIEKDYGDEGILTREDVAALLYKETQPTQPVWAESKPKSLTSTVPPKYIDRLYDSLMRMARKNNSTFEKVIKALERQLPLAIQRHQETIEHAVLNTLFPYTNHAILANELMITQKALAAIETRVLREAEEHSVQRRTPRKRGMTEAAERELLYLKAKYHFAQGYKRDVVMHALRLSPETAEQFEFRWRLEQEKLKRHK